MATHDPGYIKYYWDKEDSANKEGKGEEKKRGENVKYRRCNQ